MSSPAQIAANQANAQHSTGPVTPEGKATVAQNALKTGLTGRTVLLPTDDAELYARHLERYRAEFTPVGDAETQLVQSMADTAWRLARIPGLESAIYAAGLTKVADLHPQEEDPQRRAALLHAEVFLAYERPIRNLQLQEARLRRFLEKDRAALKELQQQRSQKEKKDLTQAAEQLIEAIRNGQARRFDPAPLGFVFSIGTIEARAAELQPQLLAAYQANKPRHLRNAA